MTDEKKQKVKTTETEKPVEVQMYEDQKEFQLYLTERAEKREDYYKYMDNLKENNDLYLGSGINFELRTIDLDTDVNSDTMALYKKAVRIMESADPEVPIKLNISSGGGSIYSGLGLYGLLATCKCPIHTFAEGLAMSMGLILFLAGDVRDCYEETTFMAHSAASGAEGKVFEMKVDLKEVDRLNNLLISILAKKTKKDLKFWKTELEFKDRFYNKKQAKKLGIL